MLEQLLKKYYESDKEASEFPEFQNELSERDSRINAEVLSLIEKEKHMKHLRIKPLIIAAAVSVVGIMSVALTVNASVDKNAVEESRPSYGTGSYDDEFTEKFVEYTENQQIIEEKYLTGRIKEAVKNGGITEKQELDDRDIVGFVPYNEETSHGHKMSGLDEAELELVRQIEEDPGSLGLIPAGKTESYESGLRIVNRHFENTNEPEDGKKRYYSVRRVYTDDENNTLLASIYFSCVFEYAPGGNGIELYHDYGRHYSHVKNIFLDHTGSTSDSGSGAGGIPVRADTGAEVMTMYTFHKIRPALGNLDVTIGQIIAVSSDGVQWID